MRNAYIRTLTELAAEDDRIVALVADNGAIVYDDYRAKYPTRFFNMGISEANMVGVAAGLSASGKRPFAYTIASFLTMRAFEQIRVDVCMQEMNVALVGIGVGFVYSDLGPTHHTVEDIALMRTLPNLTIISPADPLEAAKATRAAAALDTPVYLRLATSGTPSIYEDDYPFELGKGVRLAEGSDLTIFACGNILREVLAARALLARDGIHAGVINLHTIKPIDRDIIRQAHADTGRLMVVEEHTIHGGLGSIVAEVLTESDLGPIRLEKMGLDTFPVGYGTYAEMLDQNGLDAAHIAREAARFVEAV